mgnify:CR=1 FL=1
MNDINIMPLIMAFVIMAVILGGITIVSHIYSLNRIKSKTVGDGQHGTARWATKAEIRRAYEHIVYTPEKWRKEAQRGRTTVNKRWKASATKRVLSGTDDLAASGKSSKSKIKNGENPVRWRKCGKAYHRGPWN